MIETAAVWLDEAMTPALRTFLDQAIQVTAAEREFISPATFLDASVPRSRSLGEVGFTNPAISCKSFGGRLVRPSEYRGS
jgi:hypothetical protein